MIFFFQLKSNFWKFFFDRKKIFFFFLIFKYNIKFKINILKGKNFILKILKKIEKSLNL
jgi:hypothetical protein